VQVLLLNLLIAMMTDTYTDVNSRALIEWKCARARARGSKAVARRVRFAFLLWLRAVVRLPLRTPVANGGPCARTVRR